MIGLRDEVKPVFDPESARISSHRGARGLLRTVQGPVMKASWNALHDTAAALGFGVASYRSPDRVDAMKTVRRLRRGRGTLITPLEAHQLLAVVKATAKLGGAMAEVGVFRGASARLIREVDVSRPLHLFDTFEGLPEPGSDDTSLNHGQFSKGEFACSLEDVRAYLGGLPGVHFYKGLFPETASAVDRECFSFVHTDVDLYSSARAVLEFFYPRLLRGGVLLTHDFATCPGPRRAFTEFFEQQREPLLELPGDQALIVKISG